MSLIALKYSTYRKKKSAPTARDYMQDGLVAMWDGIENAGFGVHDANAMAWKDLSGNGLDFSINADSGATWTDDGLSDTSTKYVYLASAPFSATLHHWEVVADATMPDLYSIVNVFAANNGSQIYNAAFFDCYAHYPYNVADPVYMNAGGYGRNGWYPLDGQTHRFSGSFSCGWDTYMQRTGAVGYSDDVEIEDANAENRSYAIYPDSGTIVIGRLKTSDTGKRSSFNGKIRSIRLYSRKLTASEVAANYAIDKARFNLP